MREPPGVQKCDRWTDGLAYRPTDTARYSRVSATKNKNHQKSVTDGQTVGPTDRVLIFLRALQQLNFVKQGFLVFLS